MATFASPTLDATLPEDVETLDFETLRGRVAHAIWGVDNKATLQSVWFVLQQTPPVMNWTKPPEKRPLGILDGKAKIVFKDDFEMTTEELLGLK